jgi:hypothetical protein
MVENETRKSMAGGSSPSVSTIQFTGGGPIVLRHADGRPVQAGDLKEGQAFTFDPATGIIAMVKAFVDRRCEICKAHFRDGGCMAAGRPASATFR